jgi:hypothetical protein
MSWLSDRAFGLRDAPLFRPQLEGGANIGWNVAIGRPLAIADDAKFGDT